MASIKEHFWKRGEKRGQPYWKVVVRMKGFATVVSFFDSEADAKTFERETEAKFKTERAEDEDPRSTLPKSGNWDDEMLVDLLDLFGRSEACSNRHWGLLPTVRKAVGTITIGQLRPSWVDNYVDQMRQTKTLRDTFFAYESIFAQLCFINAVMKWRCKKLDFDRRRLTIDTDSWPNNWQNKRTRRLWDGEEAALMSTLAAIDSPARAHWGLLVRLCIETCARLQELVYAEWPEFSKNERYWNIPSGHTKAKNGRQMPLTDKAKAALRELKALASPANPRIFHPMGSPDSVSCLFHRYAVKARLVDFRFHDLRHEGISRFVSSQYLMDLGRIGLLVGHSTTEMTKRYTHLRGDEVADMLVGQAPQAQPVQPALAATTAIAMSPFTFSIASMRIESWLSTPKVREPAGAVHGLAAPAPFLETPLPMPPLAPLPILPKDSHRVEKRGANRQRERAACLADVEGRFSPGLMEGGRHGVDRA